MRVGTPSSVALAALLLSGGLGCSSPDAPVPVSGKVTLDGEPVAGAAVTFVPAGAGRLASAETETDGGYKMMTKDPGADHVGAAPGDYTVTIVWEPPPPPMFREGGHSREELHKAYDQEVAKKKAAAAYEAKLKKVGKGVSIPSLYSNPSTTPLKVKVPAPDGRADFALKSKP